MNRVFPYRFMLLIVLFACITFSPGAQERGSEYDAEYEPYRDSEFPGWALELRRAEVLFFGSLPFTLFMSNVGFDLFTYVDSNFNAEYLPLFSPGSGGAPIDNEERVYRIAAALTGSLLIALIDKIIGDIQDDRRNR